MAFDLYYTPAIGFIIILAELLFWVFVLHRILKYKKRKNIVKRWSSPFKTQK